MDNSVPDLGDTWTVFWYCSICEINLAAPTLKEHSLNLYQAFYTNNIYSKLKIVQSLFFKFILDSAHTHILGWCIKVDQNFAVHHKCKCSMNTQKITLYLGWGRIKPLALPDCNKIVPKNAKWIQAA